MINFLNPFALVVDIFKGMYPDKSCEITFCQEMYKKSKAYGETFFPDDKSTPLVSIEIDMPVIGAIEILAHELSHVAVGEGKGHGKEWEKVFDNIFNEFNKRGEEHNKSFNQNTRKRPLVSG